MPIDPCEEGCLNHNIGAGALPTAGDDPCNTAGNGYYCAGSYWLVNAGVDGDCERLYLRTGSDCNVDQWIEISLAEVISDTVDPVDGTDCCPPGTMWHNTATGDLFMSYNYDGLCRWCNICAAGDATHTSTSNYTVSPEVTYEEPGGTPFPPGTTTGIAPATVSITNPSATRPMDVQVVWQGYTVDFSFQDSSGPMNFSYAVQPHYYLTINGAPYQPGDLQNSPPSIDAIATGVGLQATSYEQDYPTGSFTRTIQIGPGDTLTASMDATLLESIPHNMDTNARVVLSSGSISMMGSTV